MSVSTPPNATAFCSVQSQRIAIADDPNRFIPFCLTDSTGTSIRQAAVHRELQAFLSAHSRALIELPRDHGKTTQVCGRILWEMGRNPNLRVKILCATDAIAAERGRFLRDAIESNVRLQRIFPELEPGEPWSGVSFTVRRTAGVIGPSVSAVGIGAGSTGTRADLLICDDIVDVKSLSGRATRERVRLDFENNVLNLLEPDGRFWGLSTPWHGDDLNAQLKKNGSYALFRRAIDERLTPVWPEKWSRKKLLARRAEIGEAAFARGYHLLPVAEGNVLIPASWLQFWLPPMPVCDTIVLAIDPAVSEKSSADATAFVVLGKKDGTVYCLDAVAHRVSTPDLFPLIEKAEKLWRPDTIWIESNAAFAGVRDLLKQSKGFGPKVRGTASRSAKADRLRTLSVRIRRGEFLLMGNGNTVDPTQQELADELTTFPFGEHDDLADAAAMGTEYLFGIPEPRVWV